MDKYFNLYREMISLRGLTDHTLKSYSTYIRSYLDYLQNILHKSPEDVSWQELRDFIQWLQKERNLADRTINCVISQLRFTMKQKLPGSQKSADFPYQALKCFLNLTDSLCGNYRSFPAKCF